MKREYPETRTRFTEEEDDLLRIYSDMNLSCSEIAEALSRPVGSIYTRRRYLGLGKKRGEYGPRVEQCFEMTEEEAAADTPAELDLWEFRATETMRRYVVYFYGGCLLITGLLAFFGGV